MQVNIGRDQADVTVPSQDSHHCAGHAGGHVSSLFDRWDQMVQFSRQKQRGNAQLAESVSYVVCTQQLQAVDVALTTRVGRDLHELPNLLPVCMPRMETEGRQPPHQAHCSPRQDAQAPDRQAEAILWREEGK